MSVGVWCDLVCVIEELLDLLICEVVWQITQQRLGGRPLAQHTLRTALKGPISQAQSTTTQGGDCGVISDPSSSTPASARLPQKAFGGSCGNNHANEVLPESVCQSSLVCRWDFLGAGAIANCELGCRSEADGPPHMP